MTNAVEIAPYNPQWPIFFEEEAARIKLALGDNCSVIHHIGSTSIFQMCAKPIVDIIPVVFDTTKVDEATAAMVELGYDAKGENGMLFRRFFTKFTTTGAFNVHIYEEGAGEIERLILFRDWMRTHPKDAKDYANLKTSLAAEHPNDRLRYTIGKENFVAAIDKQTGFSGWRIVKALTDREWHEYHRIRKEQIFDLLNIEYNPNHFTLKDKAHVHLVLYKGSEIAGVAQLEYLKTPEVALRPFAIDTPYQGQGLGSTFLTAIEKWVLQQGCNIIRLHANPRAVRFYERHGFSRMPFDEAGRGVNAEAVDMGKTLNNPS